MCVCIYKQFVKREGERKSGGPAEILVEGCLQWVRPDAC